MFKKKITIFISVFIIVGIIILVVYSLLSKKTGNTTDTTAPWYQDFNPFGSGSNVVENNTEQNTNTETETENNTTSSISKFSQITDFAVAGATFLEDTRAINNDQGDQPKQIKVIISAKTVEGRKEIQTILNETLSPSPKLVVDGVFGKSATQAIKDFQKLNNIPITGVIDETTAPYFTKISTNQTESQFEKAPSIRFVQSMNGHIYKMFLDNNTKEKISNSTIPGIYEAFFDNTGNTVVYRYSSDNKVVSSFMATLGAPKGEFLPQNISDFSISKDKTKFFYITKGLNGSVGTVGVFNSTKRDSVFSSPLTEWTSEWDANQELFLTTKPSYDVPGSVFKVNTSNNTISKVFGGVLGLTTSISPKGDSILYSTSTKSGPKLEVFNIINHTTKDLGIGGLSEKCVWSNNDIDIYCAAPNIIIGGQYPDVWYQGLVSFDDYFIKINTITGDKTAIANSKEETPIDATYLFLDKTETKLFFINKKDSTLWSLNLE